MTEDADLGIRLWREGYRTEMISRPTLEDAPVRLRDWLPQRTRWFKGWYQTLAVHTRRPGNMMRRLSFRAYVIINILLFATVISALVHPFFLVSAIWQLFVLLVEAEMSLARLALAWVEWSTILLSYFAFMALCWRATTPKQRPALRKVLYLVPLYWVLQSYAAWRAIYQLVVRPFHWEKTPHTPHRKKSQALVQKAI